MSNTNEELALEASNTKELVEALGGEAAALKVLKSMIRNRIAQKEYHKRYSMKQAAILEKAREAGITAD